MIKANSYQRFFSRVTERQQQTDAVNTALEEDAAELKTILDDSSSKNRNLFVGFLGVLIYTLVMTLSVTDEDLLMGRMTMRIPLVDLGLLPVAWFSVVPVLLFILHIDLLHNLHEHLGKLIAWREVSGGQLDRRLMQPFFYDFALTYQRRGWIGELLDWFVWLMVYMLPLFALLVVQIRFGAYQNLPVSVLHLFLVLADAGAYWWFYPKWEKEQVTAHGRFARQRDWLNHSGVQKWLALIVFICLWLLLSDRWDGGFIGGYQQPLSVAWILISLVVVATGICQRQVCYYVLLLTALAFAGLSTWFCSAWQLDVANGFIKNVNGAYLEHLLPRLVVTNRLFIKVDEDEKRALEMLTDYQNAQNQPNVDSPQAKQVMKSVATAKSSTEEGNETARQWWQQGARQDWEGRSFNFADLSGSLMARANLKFAKLEGASLYRAQLQGANLSMAQMRGATLIDAQMQEVDLGMALLQGAFLGRARMQEARLSGAQMQGANLGMAQMQGADLRGTQMQGAYLYSAQMQGANLSHARMQGADLMGAQMQGVVLTEAQMQGTDVSWAQLQGAYCLSTEGLQTQFRNSERIGKASELDNCQKTGTFGALDQEAVDTIITQLPGNLSYPFRTQVIERLGQPANQGKAICGKLTPEMAQIIEAHWNDRVPRGITAQWAKQSHFCFPSTLDKKAMP